MEPGGQCGRGRSHRCEAFGGVGPIGSKVRSAPIAGGDEDRHKLAQPDQGKSDDANDRWMVTCPQLENFLLSGLAHSGVSNEIVERPPSRLPLRT